jgi:polygalacturonase
MHATNKPKGHIIDGNGPAWWDGLGSNGGVQKPNHFFVGSKITGMSFIQNLNIKNWPVHCFSISNCVGLTFQNINLDNSDGYAPNNRSNGLPAAHNSDGFDLSGCNYTSILNSTVVNQDGKFLQNTR